MPGLFSLGLFQKNFNSTSRVTAPAINLGSTRGKGSSTRMFNYCKQHSSAPSLCINQFVHMQKPPTPAPIPVPVGTWTTFPGVFDLTNTDVTAIASDDNCNIYVAVFSYETYLANVRKWNGSQWTTIEGVFNDYIIAIAIDSAENIYIGGSFTDDDFKFIAKWNGASWGSVGKGIPNGYGVFTLKINDNGHIYAGGIFDGAQNTDGTINTDCQNVAIWNGVSWSSLGKGISYSCYAFGFLNNNRVVVGGDFYTAYNTDGTNVSCGNIAIWNGSNWLSVGNGSDGPVYSLAVDSNHNIYVSGDFLNCYNNDASQVNCNHIAKWSGSEWSHLGNGLNNFVGTIAIDNQNNLFAGGHFTSGALNNVAQWNGSEWNPLQFGVNSDLQSLVICNNRVFAIGDLDGAYKSPFVNNCFSFNQTNNIVSSIGKLLSPQPFQPFVKSFCTDAQNNLFLAGYFDGVDNSNVNNVAKIDSTFSTLSLLGRGVNNTVQAVAVDANNNVYVGGFFGQAFNSDGTVVTCKYIAMWNGTTWSSLGAGLNGYVTSLAIDSTTGHVFVGGAFTKTADNAVTCNYIAQWNPIALMWSPVGNGTEINNTVECLVFNKSSEKLFVGCEIHVAGLKGCLARWDKMKMQWDFLGYGNNGSNVTSIAVDSQDNVYVGGNFFEFGNNSSSNIAKWNATTQTWSVLSSGLNGYVASILVDGNDNVFAGGSFSATGNEEMKLNKLGKWNGSQWSALNISLSSFSSVDAMFIQNSSSLIVSASYCPYLTDESQGFICWNI